MKIAVIDLETSIKNKDIGSNKASPFYKENCIVLGGVLVPDMFTSKFHFFNCTEPATYIEADHFVGELLDDVDLLVGQNIKFDLLYLRRFFTEHYHRWVSRGGKVWDTQVAEYLLSGQKHKMWSLDKLSAAYGGTQKDDAIKEYWNNGVDTEDIPHEELLEYLKYDLENTFIVFQEQEEMAMNLCDLDTEKDMNSLLSIQMDTLLCLTEMEYNGMYVNRSMLQDQGAAVKTDMQSLEVTLNGLMQSFLPDGFANEVNVNSSDQVGWCMFGGKVPCVTEEPELDEDGKPKFFKSGKRKGQVRMKKVKYEEECQHFFDPSHGDLSPKSGKWVVNEKVLTDMKNQAPIGTSGYEFLEVLLRYRRLKKDYSTYYEGLSSKMFGDFVHPNFNQTNTATGRLSSSNPNAQNFSSKSED